MGRAAVEAAPSCREATPGPLWAYTVFCYAQSTMPPSDFEMVFRALQEAGARYLVVGGVAVVLHGHPRFTADLDLVIALDARNVAAVVQALGSLDYRPRAPVAVERLADPQARREWIEQKGLTVFSLWSPRHSATEVDLFVEEPFPFDEAYARAVVADLGGLRITVAAISDLIDLKSKAGRARDFEDIAALQELSRGDHQDT